MKIVWSKTIEISKVTPEWAPRWQIEDSLPRPSDTTLLCQVDIVLLVKRSGKTQRVLEGVA